MAGRAEIEPSTHTDSEVAPLLGLANESNENRPESEHEYWNQLVATVQYAFPLVLTSALQYSLRLTSLFFVGRLGTLELGATALAQMTTNITGLAALQGFATSLDTLCPETFAAGKPHLVGLYVQRTLCMLMVISGFVSILWWFAEPLLGLVIPNEPLVAMTASLMRIYIALLPGYATFEVGKRFIRAQGSATPIFYFLLFGVPANILLHWLFIHIFEWGVLGAAAAVSLTHLLLSLVMLLYICSSNAKQCWDGFKLRAFQNWAPVIALAIPDLIMVEVDVLSWEILILISSYLGDKELGAQTVLGSIMAIAFQIPFPFSVASSFQVASAIGQGDVRRARVASTVSLVSSCVIGVVDLVPMIVFQKQIPTVFSRDAEVLALATACMPLISVVQVFDAISVVGNGVLRGLGRQKIGSIAMVIMYYFVGLPFSVWSTFSLDWRLHGLWAGLLIGVTATSFIDIIAIWRLNFEKCVERSAHRTTHA